MHANRIEQGLGGKLQILLAAVEGCRQCCRQEVCGETVILEAFVFFGVDVFGCSFPDTFGVAGTSQVRKRFTNTCETHNFQTPRLTANRNHASKEKRYHHRASTPKARRTQQDLMGIETAY